MFCNEPEHRTFCSYSMRLSLFQVQPFRTVRGLACAFIKGSSIGLISICYGNTIYNSVCWTYSCNKRENRSGWTSVMSVWSSTVAVLIKKLFAWFKTPSTPFEEVRTLTPALNQSTILVLSKPKKSKGHSLAYSDKHTDTGWQCSPHWVMLISLTCHNHTFSSQKTSLNTVYVLHH